MSQLPPGGGLKRKKGEVDQYKSATLETRPGDGEQEWLTLPSILDFGPAACDCRLDWIKRDSLKKSGVGWDQDPRKFLTGISSFP